MHEPQQKRVAWEHRARACGAPVSESVSITPLDRVRRPRRSAGDAARKFWSRTRNRRLGGFKFRREVPLGPYIADFLCLEARLVVEIDGDQHAASQAYDAARTRYLERIGYAVIRIPTHEILRDIGQVMDRVHLALWEREMEFGRR